MSAPRRLDINQYQSMVAELRQFRGQKLRVLLLAEHEPRQYGEHIIKALEEAGWMLDVRRSINSISQPTYGLHVYGPHPESSLAIQALISELVEAGNPVYSAGSNDTEFQLSITLKPDPGVSITTPGRDPRLWHLPSGSNWTLYPA